MKAEDFKLKVDNENHESSNRNAIILAGVLLAFSFVLLDKSLLDIGGNSISFFDFVLSANLVISSGFITCLVAGYSLGKARIYDSSGTVIFFGCIWVVSLFGVSVLIQGLGIGWITIEVITYFSGTLGLGYYRYLQGDMELESSFKLVLFASSSLNLLFFIWGV